VSKPETSSERWLVRLRVPVGFVAGLAYLLLARPRLDRVLLGLPLVVIGEALRLVASGCLVKSRQLTTSGPYRFVRHPLYLGSAILLLGFAIAGGHLGLGLGLGSLFALVYAPVARREERVLEERFGAEYELWRHRVPALLPWPGRVYPARVEGAFSWGSVRRHREYRAVAGEILLVGFLLWRALHPYG